LCTSGTLFVGDELLASIMWDILDVFFPPCQFDKNQSEDCTAPLCVCVCVLHLKNVSCISVEGENPLMCKQEMIAFERASKIVNEVCVRKVTPESIMF